MNPERRLIELSHVIEPGVATYPGLPAPIVDALMTHEASRARYAPGTEFHIGRITMAANTGTYVDAPFHRFPGADDIAALPLDKLADLPCVVVRARDAGVERVVRDAGVERVRDAGVERLRGAGVARESPGGRAADARIGSHRGTTRAAGSGRAIDAAAFDGLDLAGRAVLVETGWSAHWGTPAYFAGHPYLTASAADRLVEAGAALVGIDSLNIDDTEDGTRPVHTALLAAGIPVVEHMCGLAALPAEGARFFAAPLRVRGMGSFPVRAFAIV